MDRRAWLRAIISSSKSSSRNLERKAQLAYYLAFPRRRQISAMIRVKNEVEYLYAAAKSIIDHVEEVVIVDNLSLDGTPLVIERLYGEHPGKVLFYKYPYDVRKVGEDNWELAKSPASHSSPRLLANYYNWCLRKCTKTYVLKWDGDMIATSAFYSSLAEFRQVISKEVVWIKGANLHPGLKHLIAPNQSGLERVQANCVAPTTLANWLAPYTDYEPRVFPRAFARYDSGFWWCERLRSPFFEAGNTSRYEYKAGGVAYLHMKYCKRDPYANLSDDFKKVIASSLGQGPTISAEMADILRRWELDRTRP